MTKTWEIQNRDTAVVIGYYLGATEDEALDAMARDAGADSFADIPNGDRESLLVRETDGRYTLTPDEAEMYDSEDEREQSKLRASLADRFGCPAAGRAVVIEVYHPDGFVIEQYA